MNTAHALLRLRGMRKKCNYLAAEVAKIMVDRYKHREPDTLKKSFPGLKCKMEWANFGRDENIEEQKN
jgi:hypothetical protein